MKNGTAVSQSILIIRNLSSFPAVQRLLLVSAYDTVKLQIQKLSSRRFFGIHFLAVSTQ